MMITRALKLFSIMGLMCCLSACSFLPGAMRPEIKSVTPRVTGLSWDGVEMAFDLDVSNPWPTPITAPALDYVFSVQGTPLGQAHVSAGQRIPAAGSGTLSLPMTLRNKDMIAAISGLKDVAEFDYALEGEVGLSAMGVKHALPFSHAGKLPILRPPSISITDFTPGKLSLNGASFDLKADLFNPNAFGIDADKLGYVLELGGRELAEIAIKTDGEIGAQSHGKLRCEGKVKGLEALGSLGNAFGSGGLNLRPTGELETPYGKLSLPE